MTGLPSVAGKDMGFHWLHPRGSTIWEPSVYNTRSQEVSTNWERQGEICQATYDQSDFAGVS